MVLAKQAVELPFGVGVDQSVQKEILDPAGNVAVAHNVAVTKHGAFTKREGLSQYTQGILGGGLIASGVSLHDYDESYPVMTDAERLYDWSPTANRWSARDYVPEAVATRVSGMQPPAFGFVASFESVIMSGCRLIAFTAPRGTNAGAYDDDVNTNFSDIYVQVSDVVSGAVLYGPVLLAQVFGPNAPSSFTVATVNGYAVVTGQTTVRNGSGVVTSTSLVAWVFDLANAPQSAPTAYTLEGPQPVGTLYTGYLRVAIEPNGNRLIYLKVSIASAPPAGTSFILFTPSNGTATFPASPVTNFLPVGASGSQTFQIQHDAAANLIWLFYLDDTGPSGFRVVGISATTFTVVVPGSYLPLVSTLSPSIHTMCACLGEIPPGGTVRDLWITISRSIEGGYTSNVQCTRVSVVAGAFVFSAQHPAGINAKRGNISAYSDPFNRGGRWYQWFCTTPWTGTVNDGDRGTSMRNAVLCEVRDDTLQLRPVANIAPLLVSSTNKPRYPHRVQMNGAAAYETPVPVVRNASTAHIEIASVDFADKRRMQGAQFGDLLALSAASPSFFDGEQVMEIGFIAPPTIDIVDIAWVSGSPPAARPNPKWPAGTYSFFAVWSHVDARGNRHVSAPSNIITRTFANDRAVTMTHAPLVITARQNGVKASSVRLDVYQTRMNEGTFYRGVSTTTLNVDSQLNPLMTLDVVDTNELFYTQPGVPGAAQFKFAPPPLRGLIQHNGALAGIAEDGRTIWFSGQHLPGEGPWFYPAFVAYVDDPSQLTALASMDGRLFAFTRTSVWALDGPGFADSGEGGYGPPMRVAVDSGCVSEKSVVVTPVGILYQTDLGIALLTRSGEIAPFGRMVEDTLAAYPRVTSAVLCRATGEVRFTCTTQAAGGASVWLVYDYRNQLWLTGSADASLASTTEIVSACLSSRGSLDDPTRVATWHVLFADGRVATSNPAQYDNGNPFSTTVETGWLKIAGLQGFQRIWRILFLFDRPAAEGSLKISLAYDYDPAIAEEREWTSAELAALPRQQVEIHCARQRCESVKVRIESGGEGLGDAAVLDYLGLRIVCGVKGKTPMGKAFR